MIETVSEMCPNLVNQVTDSFKQMIENNGNLPLEKSEQNPSLGVLNVLSRSKQEFANLRGNLLLMLSFHEMLKSSSFKQKLVKGPFIDMLATIIDGCETVSSPQMNEFRKATFNVVDQLAKHSKLLNAHYNEIIEKLLPAIANKIESKNAEVRFDALKAFSDYVTQFMCEEKIYQPLEDTLST